MAKRVTRRGPLSTPSRSARFLAADDARVRIKKHQLDPYISSIMNTKIDLNCAAFTVQ